MSNLWNRFCIELYGMMQDIKTEYAKNRKSNKRLFIGSATVGAICNFAMLACADDLDTLGKGITDLIDKVYTVSFPIITGIAVLAAMFAFVMRMTANQQKAAQATSWLVRIGIAYAGVNMVGLLAKVIHGTSKTEWREMPDLTP